MSEKRPTFQHDCDECVFLGRYQSSGTQDIPLDIPHVGRVTKRAPIPEEDCDLYYCEIGPMPTVIARYSDEGSDYKSGMLAAEYDSALAAAKIAAKSRGLLKE